MEKDKDTIGLKSIVVKYLHHWKLFLFVFLFSLIPAILYLLLYPRTYEFMARIQLIEDKESGMVGSSLLGGEAAGLMKSFGIGGNMGGSLSIDDEMSILASNRMLRLTSQRLGINVSYSRPYSFYKLYDDTPLILTIDSATMTNLTDEYTFKVSVSNGNINVKLKSYPGGYKQNYSFTSLPAEIKAEGNTFILDYNPNVSEKKSFKLKIKCMPLSWYAETLEKKIEIEDMSKTSNVLELTYKDHSKKRGLDVLNTLIDEYNKDAETYKKTEDAKTMDFVDKRISKVMGDLQAVELDIEKYKTANNMTLLENDVEMYGEEFKELQKQIVEIQTNSHLVDMINDYVKDPKNKYSVVPSLMTAAEGEKGGGAISTYNEAIIERDKLLKNSNEKNPMFKIIDNQVEKLREGVFVMIANTQKTYNTALKDLQSKERALMSKMKTVPTKEREYISFRRDQEIFQGLYLLLLQKREETVLSLGKMTDRARRIDPAFVKKKPVGPRKIFALIGIFLFTIIVPIGYIIFKELFVSLKNEYKRTL